MVSAEKRVEWAVKQFTETCRAAGVRNHILREVGEPFSLIIDQTRYHDLMVLGLKSLFEFGLVDEPHNALVRQVQAGVRPLIAVFERLLSGE